jgi:hypothetical protein
VELSPKFTQAGAMELGYNVWKKNSLTFDNGA